jgi:hypothetical protein
MASGIIRGTVRNQGAPVRVWAGALTLCMSAAENTQCRTKCGVLFRTTLLDGKRSWHIFKTYSRLCMPNTKERRRRGVCPSYATAAFSKIRRITRKFFLLLWLQCLLVFTKNHVNSFFSDITHFNHLQTPFPFI